MNKSTRLVITAAALAGLYAGSLASSAQAEEKAGSAAQQESKDKSSCGGKEGCGAKEKDKASCSGKEGCGAKKDGKEKATCSAKGGCSAKDKKNG